MLLTIACAGRVLALFTEEKPERGVTEVSQELKLSKSKAHALLASLASVGLLRHTEAGRYRIGWSVLAMNRVLGATTEFVRYARPAMHALAARTGELIHLGTLDDGQVVYVHRLAGPRAVKLELSALGNRLPAHCSGIGKVLLARLSPEVRRDLLASAVLGACTPHTITDPGLLEAQLTDVCRQGFAFDWEETLEGISCVAAPIAAPGYGVVAAMSITGPSDRVAANQELYTRCVVQAAKHASRRLLDADEQRATLEAELALAPSRELVAA
jgi:DNA-binding IclR family transcriptional regulator